MTQPDLVICGVRWASANESRNGAVLSGMLLAGKKRPATWSVEGIPQDSLVRTSPDPTGPRPPPTDWLAEELPYRLHDVP